MRHTGENHDDFVVRPSRVVRGGAAVVFLCGLALPFLISPISAGLFMGACLALAGFAGLRVGVHVGPDGVVAQGVLRTRRTPWTEIERFGVTDGSAGGIYVLTTDGDMKQLPWEELAVLGTRSRRADLCGQLEEVRTAHQG